MSYLEGFNAVAPRLKPVIKRRDAIRKMIDVVEASLNTTEDDSFYRTYAALFEYVRIIQTPASVSTGWEDVEECLRRGINQCHRHWNKEYIGTLPTVLLQRLIYWQDQQKHVPFMPIVNSSGVGKSRCIDELGKSGPLVVSVVLRAGDDNGYPPGDPEIYDFLRSIEVMSCWWQTNVLALSFVTATIQGGMF